jgi:PHD/YefM family antitoxin component YafN of YafNO toxin-antitoxin module
VRNMPKTITINEDIFNEMIRKKEEFDAIVESIELMNNPEVQESIRKSKEDIKTGRTHNLKDALKK